MRSERALQRRSSTTRAAITDTSERRGTADEVGGRSFAIVALVRQRQNDCSSCRCEGDIQDSRRGGTGRKRQAERASCSSLSVRALVFIRVHMRRKGKQPETQRGAEYEYPAASCHCCLAHRVCERFTHVVSLALHALPRQARSFLLGPCLAALMPKDIRPECVHRGSPPDTPNSGIEFSRPCGSHRLGTTCAPPANERSGLRSSSRRARRLAES